MFQEELMISFEKILPTDFGAALSENYNICIIIALLCILIYFMCMPLDWNYEVEDSGWIHKSDYHRNKRQRKLGNLPPVYPNGWFAVAESSQVKIQQVISVSLLGENFAVFRTSIGKVQILDAYCPHLGANMAVGGKVRGGCLECPFHLWQFSGETGDCTSIPNVPNIPKSAKVKKWHSCECNDFIFVWYHAENENPSWYPTDETKYPYIGRNQFEVNCHIQEIPENGSDFTHFTALHGSSALSGGDLRSHEVGWARWLLRHEWTSKWEPIRHEGHVYIKQNMLIFQKFRLAFCEINVRQLGPGLVILRFRTTLGPVVLVQTVTPREPLIQTVIHRIYAPLYLLPYAKFILICEGGMFKRDVMIWNNKRYLEKPLLTKEDTTISQYRRWFSQFYTTHSPTYSAVKEGMDW